MSVILGGGIAGLSAGYYALKNAKVSSIALFEASNRVGGWIQSCQLPDKTLFEEGPRMIMIRGRDGLEVLEMVDELKLSDKIIPIKSRAMQQLFYVDKKIEPILPTKTWIIGKFFKAHGLLGQSAFSLLMKEWRTPMIPKEDESAYNFIERRFGQKIADNIISPMICGIYGGDARNISILSSVPKLFEVEQKYGSVTKGFVKDMLIGTKSEIISTCPLIQTAITEMWSGWCLRGGLEQLPQAIANHLQTNGLEIQTNNVCENILFKPDRVELTVSGETKECSRVISGLPAKELAKLVEGQHPKLSEKLKAIPSVTIGLVNFQFPNIKLPQGFGILIRPKEELPVLGIIFDSSYYPNEDSTKVLTVMMGGAWFEKYFGQSPSEDHLLAVATEHLETILGITKVPLKYNVAILKDCIPQYMVGHKKHVKCIQEYIDANQIPLHLCGSSYHGVGVISSILSGKNAVANIVD